jgi:outer membrane murein-binding lipoprotein Lpp
MRAISPILLVFISAIILSGCGDNAAKSTRVPTNGQEANARIDAAMQIVSHNEKDAALAAACRDAAKIGEGDAVMRGIPMIVSHNLVDEVARDCAISLRDSGKSEAAAAVAGMIKSHILRDEVLKNLAAGK